MEFSRIKTQTGDCGPCSLWERLLELSTAGQESVLDYLGWIPATISGLSLERKSLFHAKCGKKRVPWFAKRARQDGVKIVVLKERYLASHETWSLLSEVTRSRIARLTKSEMQRCVDVWSAIEDSLLLATPEAYASRRPNPLIVKLWKWVWENVVQHNGVLHTIRLYKSMVSRWKWHALQSHTPRPHVIRGAALFDEQGDPAHRYLVGPWAWLRQVLERGLHSKSVGTRFMHLASTRGLPSPSLREMEKGLHDHGHIITHDRGFKLSQRRLDLYCKLALRLGRYARSRLPKNYSSHSHLSLSDSASFDSGRAAGGRAVGFGRKYCAWANHVSESDLSQIGILGYPYEVRAGLRRFQTMGRVESDFLHPESALIESDNSFEIALDNLEDFKYEDRIFGLDAHTGVQILQFSFEEGIKAGVIAGPPFLERGVRHSVVGEPQIRMVPIGEPGGKVRTITVGEDWVTQFLSPFGHELIAFLSQIPSARAGLGAAAQAYEWVKRLGRRKGIDSCEEELFFLTSDLSQASEYLEHEVSRALLKSFCRGAGLSCTYMDLCTDLLTSPRFIDSAEGNFVYPYAGLSTHRGCLMGDPGTKAALTLTMLVAEEMAFYEYHARKANVEVSDFIDRGTAPDSVWRVFAAAGDDHVAVGPREYLTGIDDCLEELGAVLSREKCFLSKIGTFFTEELILRTELTRMELTAPLWETDYQTTLHVDSVKVRLLSPCSKVTLVRDDKNPALGKSRQFLKKLSWLPAGFSSFKALAMARFRERFSSYLPWDHPLVYFPRHLGGLGFRFHGEPEKMREAILRLPPSLLAAIDSVYKGTSSEFVQQALWLFSSNTSFRGITMRTVAEEQIKFVFKHLVPDSRHGSLEDLIPEWNLMTRRQQMRAARQHGLASLSDAIQMMERPTYFKQVLANLGSLMKSDPLYRKYALLESDMDEWAERLDCSFNELETLFPELFSSWKRSQAEWFCRQAYIETWAFTRCSGAGSRCDPQDNLVDHGEDLVTKSFTSTPLVKRPEYMARIIRRHIDKVPDSVDIDYLVDRLGEEDFSAATERPEDVWIPMHRMESLCTLSVPVKPELCKLSLHEAKTEEG